MSNTIIVNGLKWNIKERYSYGYENSIKFIEFIELTNKLPLIDLEIKFSDEIWDFNTINNIHNNRGSFRFYFGDITNEYKKIMKYYVCLKICEGKDKIPSINSKFYYVKEILKYLSENNVFEIRAITLTDITNYFEKCEKYLLITTIKSKKNALNNFLSFYLSNIEDIDIDEIKQYLSKTNTLLIKAVTEQNKIPAIPSDYFAKLINLLKNDMNNEILNEDDRAFACLMIIATQTGLRTSDLVILEVDMIETIKLINKRESHFLNYKTIKAGQGNNGTIFAFSAINELSYKAYMIITKIYKKRRKETKTNFLYIPTRIKYYPVNKDVIMAHMRKYILKNYKELDSINNKKLKDLSCIRLSDWRNSKKIIKYASEKYKKKLIGGDELYYPTVHQIRVTVATDLYNKGVPLNYIEKYMAHLSSEMSGYYVRPRDNSQEDAEYSHKVLEEVLTGKARLLGKEENINSLMDKINEFIANESYKVEKDIDTIINKLLKKVPIRKKLGGVCINSSMLRDCKTDDSTNEFYCAYGICPNHFHFFYNCNISYDEFNELKKTYEYNKENKFIRQAQKEAYKMTRLIENTLILELDELKNEVDRKGKDSILTNYPQLTYIVNNYENIYSEINKTRQEVEKWMMLMK